MNRKDTQADAGRRVALFATLALVAIALVGCGGSPGDQDPVAQASSQAGMAPAEQEHAEMFRGIDRAVAVLDPTEDSEVRGQVSFSEEPDGVRVTGTVMGLEPGSTHGLHIHTYGDVTAPDGTAAGGHYNPEDHPHALPDEAPRHAGDLGNLQADAEGTARCDIVVDNITVAGLENPVLGRAVIVHAQPDDGSQPTGAAGARLAQGVIGVAEPQDSP
jgi:Cu-Zn family superoxide dismutase